MSLFVCLFLLFNIYFAFVYVKYQLTILSCFDEYNSCHTSSNNTSTVVISVMMIRGILDIKLDIGARIS